MRSILRLFRFYYGLAGKKLLALLALMVLAVGFQTVGISFLLPILQGMESDSKANAIFRQVFAFLHLEYNLFNLLSMLVAIAVLRSVFLVAHGAFTVRIMADMLVRLRRSLARQIFRLDYQAFVHKSSGFLNNALVVECQKVVFSFKLFSMLMITGLYAVVYVSIPLVTNPITVLVLGFFGIPLFFVIRRINLATKEYSIQTSQHSAGLQKILIQSLNFFKYLKATAEHPKVLAHTDAQTKHLGRMQYKLGLLSAITAHGFHPFVILAIAGVIYFYVGMKGEDIVAHFVLLYLLANAMQKMLAMQQNLRKLLGSWGSIEVVSKLQKDLARSEERNPSREDSREFSLEDPVRFSDVGFEFEGGERVLKDITFTVEPNSTVAFVGESGVGKSTLVNLLIGLLSPTEGSMHIGDVPIESIDREKLRDQIGYITQENVIFNDTVLNNITLWDAIDGDSRLEKVRAVARQAHIDEFIEGLPNGYDSMLGEGGINISGGQRQRICIAREFYKDAKIIVFDEATSSLDTTTEREIQKHIDEFRGQKTIVLVAHRLSTVQNSDRIFVLKAGRIVEEGSYEDLCRMNGEFARMVKEQSSEMD